MIQNVVEIEPKSIPQVLPFSKGKMEIFNWFIFYTYPRAEKVVYNNLLRDGYDVYLPVNKSISVWKNRQKKLIETPLFPNYIFVRTPQYQINNILRSSKVVSCISFNNKPSIISEKEIEAIRAALTLGKELTIENKFYEGEKVRILDGPLSGNEGILIKHMGKTRFGILLNEIRYTIIIDICENSLEKIG